MNEFFAEYPKSNTARLSHHEGQTEFIFSASKKKAYVSVKLKTRDSIESVFQIFERDLDKSVVPIESEPIKIFIGHGQNKQWRDLKDHLQDLHGFEVVSYEIGARGGLSVKEVLQEMLTKSSFALLVLTGEDVDNYGEYHARENVIHELGLFQGHLGFRRAIVLKEDGIKEFSNIFGLTQIRFSQNNIRETFGEIIATIKREFS